MKISLDEEKCIGCGACVSVCPKVFEMKGLKAIAKVKETKEKCVREAAETCPTLAIEIK